MCYDLLDEFAAHVQSKRGDVEYDVGQPYQSRRATKGPAGHGAELDGISL